ncbi:Protein HEADING DATE 3A, partial [Mucuna pruriens]
MPRSTDPLVIGRVIGDVLEPFTSSISLRVLYNNCPEVINCCELKPSQIVNKPRVEIGGDDLRTFYTLVMVDPDAPSPGEEVVSYEGPRPMMGIHRIVFVLFRQSGRQTIYAPGWRQNFNTRDFSELYNLGLPVAATYFNCKRQNDSARDGRRR